MITGIGALDSDSELELVLTELIDKGEDLVGGLELRGDPVVHNNELAIRRHNSEALGGLEVTGIHALMEVTVIEDGIMEALHHVMLPND